MSYTIDTETIETVAGDYTVRLIQDEDASQPDHCGHWLFLDGNLGYLTIAHGCRR